MHTPLKSSLLALGLALAAAGAASIARADDKPQPQSVQVLHWWTSGGEAAALQALKGELHEQGVGWHDVPIAGGGGTQAMTALRARVLAGDPPTAVQMLGFDITDWARQGLLQDLTPIAQRENWAAKVPKALQAFDVYQGKWIAAPLDVHSSNWVWASREVLRRAGVSQPPATWDEFIGDLEKVRKAGFVALAAGGQSWQIATMFDGVVLSTGGPEFYRKSLIQLDQAALNSPTMLKAFERMSQLRQFVDAGYSNRDWNVATGMLIRDKAGFQMMGDWALGEFNNASQVPGQQYLCFRTPGTQGAVTFNSDAFVFFKVKPQDLPAQQLMARMIMAPRVQAGFNRVKGSAPAVLGMSGEGFNACGRKAMADLEQADRSGTLLGSMSQGYGEPPPIKNAFYDVIAREFNGQITPQQAVQQLAAAARASY